MRFPPACPELPVAELAPALAFYRDGLGFTVDWADEALGLAGLSQGACRLFMSSARYRERRQVVQGPMAVWLNAESRSHVDALHARWRSGGAAVIEEPEAKPWRLYEFLAHDPDGNLWRVFYDFAWEERERS